MVGESCAEHFRIADQRAAGFERRIQPFVRIHGDGIRLTQRSQIH
jgi:hypothetical protein